MNIKTETFPDADRFYFSLDGGVLYGNYRRPQTPLFIKGKEVA